MLATTILVLAAAASGVSAQPLSAEELGFVPKSWPEIGLVEPAPTKRSVQLLTPNSRDLAADIRRGPSNAERIKKGLSPLTPARLYDPSRVHAAPVARISSTPPDHSYDYVFIYDACFPSYDSGSVYTATSDQNAVDQCATLSGLYIEQFTLHYNDDGTYTCQVGAYGDGDSEACSQTNWVQYNNNY